MKKFRFRLKAPGVNEQEALVLPLCIGIVAVPGNAGHIFDDGEISPDDPVEQGRLADIRPAYYGDNGFRHGYELRA